MAVRLSAHRFLLAAGAVLLVVAAVGGAYALGRSNAASPGPSGAQVLATSIATPRPTPTIAVTADSTLASTLDEATPTPVVALAPTATVVTQPPQILVPPTQVNTPPPPTTTATAEPPTHAFRYGVVEGIGDDVLLIGPGPVIMRITGNAEARHFAVKGKDSNGDSTGLFVNTTEPYQGIVPLDFRSDQSTARVEITATGRWTLEVMPVSAARVINAPGLLAGSGDEVLIVSGTPDIAQILGNEDSYHFAVIAYGDFADLLVNTTEPYNGKVAVSPDATLLEINAVGAWTVRFQ